MNVRIPEFEEAKYSGSDIKVALFNSDGDNDNDEFTDGMSSTVRKGVLDVFSSSPKRDADDDADDNDVDKGNDDDDDDDDGCTSIAVVNKFVEWDDVEYEDDVTADRGRAEHCGKEAAKDDRRFWYFSNALLSSMRLAAVSGFSAIIARNVLASLAQSFDNSNNSISQLSLNIA